MVPFLLSWEASVTREHHSLTCIIEHIATIGRAGFTWNQKDGWVTASCPTPNRTGKGVENSKSPWPMRQTQPLDQSKTSHLVLPSSCAENTHTSETWPDRRSVSNMLG